MKQFITFLIFIYPLFSFAKNMCQIEISQPRSEMQSNQELNQRLKAHQKIKTIIVELQDLDLKAKNLKDLRLHFKTLENKKFETVYKVYNSPSNLWKIDFSKSQIFPQLFKNYVHLIEFNSKYYLRMYDSATEQSMINLIFESKDCIEEGPGKLLTGSL